MVTPLVHTRSPSEEERRLANPREDLAHHNMRLNAISWVLSQISKSPFSEEIESLDPPHWFIRPTFIIYNGKFDPVEHVSHFNQSMALHAWNEALMCKVFPSSLGPTAMRWFDSLDKGSIHNYEELTKAFGARFLTCSRVSKPIDALLAMCMKEGETLWAYSNK